jgi:hypothetical protein
MTAAYFFDFIIVSIDAKSQGKSHAKCSKRLNINLYCNLKIDFSNVQCPDRDLEIVIFFEDGVKVPNLDH